MTTRSFNKVIETEAALREVIGHPSQLVLEKAVTEIDEMCAQFIANSPFVLIASYDADGNVDVSPKGDPAGEFVQMLDSKTLLIPDRPGNRRADTLVNILQTGKVALIFLVPGRRETLRVNGTAQIVMDDDLMDRFIIKGKRPKLLIAVTLDEAYFHCTKCVVRSNLWSIEDAVSEMPSLAAILVNQGKIDAPVEEIEADLKLDEVEGLY